MDPEVKEAKPVDNTPWPAHEYVYQPPEEDWRYEIDKGDSSSSGDLDDDKSSEIEN